MLILKIFLDQKSAKYFLRKINFKLTTFEFTPLWSGGAALFRIFKSPASGGGGRRGGDLSLRRSPPPAEVILVRP
jgi:hypothetical protein